MTDLPRVVARLREDERLGAVLLLTGAVLAVVLANSPVRHWYHALLATRVGPPGLDLALESWANEGLLAVFFFGVGAELARELRVGSLRDRRRAALPVVAAVGGMVVPALLYLLTVTVAGRGDLAHGWAIPTATDVAFALAVLAIAGRGLPAGLRTFLLTLAVVDDLLGIVVIAVFYTDHLDVRWLAGSLAAAALFAALARLRRAPVLLLLTVAAATWGAMHEAGVPPAVAGSILGLSLPVMPIGGEPRGRAGRYEAAVKPFVVVVALPLFAFSAAGVSLGDTTHAPWAVTAGVVLGLLVGKPVGVLGGTLLGVRLGGLRLPAGVTRADLLPVGLLTGIGFTVALLVAHLSFDTADQQAAAVLGVLIGTVATCLGGVLALRGRTRAVRREQAGQRP